jgi:hypothetical protein
MKDDNVLYNFFDLYYIKTQKTRRYTPPFLLFGIDRGGGVGGEGRE